MDSLVSTEWLAGELGAGDLKIVDASAHLAGAARDAAAEFARGHLPGALYLDLGSLKDANAAVANALPSAGQFAARMAALGIANGDRVVIYDDSEVKTSARAWFILRMHGMRRVAILDGGLGKWRAEGRPLEQGAPASCPVPVAPAEGDWSKVRGKADVLANLTGGAAQMLDARDPARFTGASVDTVHGLPGGHIPGARNLFFRDLYNADGTFKADAELRAAFDGAGIDLTRPIIASCGSGVTASVLLFALDRLGVRDAALYDGSWSEWGADPATPKETGAAA